MPWPIKGINFKAALNAKRIFLSAVCLVLCLNTVKLCREISRTMQLRKRRPYVFLGVKFLGLKDFVGHVQYIGYYTDKDLDQNQNAMQFSQAQYVLAPVILDLNNLRHEFIVFDCTSPKAAMDKIKEIGAVPLRVNQFGVILAGNPAAKGLRKGQRP